jgi:two-component system response regulator AtoC
VERQMLLAALEEHDWVQTRAAESLGISERVLRYKMTRAGIRNRTLEP